MFITVVICLSILTTCLSTLSTFATNYTEEDWQFIHKVFHARGFDVDYINQTAVIKPTLSIYVVDGVCNVILLIELVTGFCVCPSKKCFISHVARLIQIFGYVSFWVSMIMEHNVNYFSSSNAIRVYVIFKHMTVFKIFRLLYLTRHVPALRIMGLTLTSSKQELKIVAFLIFILVVLFGMLMFVVEVSHSESIRNIFQAMYWALITLTTVGYGNYVPMTTAGHVVAAVCAVFGIVMLALPIGVISSTFYTFYNYQKYASDHVVLCGKTVHSSRNGDVDRNK